jgi:hypothetical protein
MGESGTRRNSKIQSSKRQRKFQTPNPNQQSPSPFFLAFGRLAFVIFQEDALA